MAGVTGEFKDLFNAFVRGPALLNEAVRGLDSGTVARRSPGEDWAIRDIVVHLADAELVRAMRIRMMLAEENPALPAFNQETWQRRLSYLWRSVEASLALFEQLRFSSGEILGQLGRQGWARTGLHPEDGEVTVETLVRRGVEHVEIHVAQVGAARAALGGPPRG